jgi:hypothetical protein
MPEAIVNGLIERKDFSKIRANIDIPDLIEIQKRSYEQFLQMEGEVERREDKGLQAALTSVFPIADYNNTAILEFSSYSLGTPKYDVRECLEQGMTFAVPLKLRVRLVVFDKEDKGPKKKVLDVREQEVYVGELPLMTERGTFIINVTERVVVSQLHRSPGASFTHDKGRTHASGKVLYSARIIPYRGSWLDFDFDARDILYVRIDRRRKMPATILLKAFGYSGSAFQLQTTVFLPTPVQQPRPPVWVAAHWPNQGPIRRAARWDGIFPEKPGGERLNPSELATLLRIINEHRTLGTPFDVVVAGDLDAVSDSELRSYQDVGATWWLHTATGHSPAATRDRLRRGIPRDEVD